MAQRDIFLTEDDYDRLQALVSGTARTRRDREHVEQLAAELERAHLVSPDDMPPDVVTMHSEVELRDLDTGEAMVFRLVYPSQADADQGRMSVLARSGPPSSDTGPATRSNGPCPVARAGCASSACSISRKRPASDPNRRGSDECQELGQHHRRGSPHLRVPNGEVGDVDVDGPRSVDDRACSRPRVAGCCSVPSGTSRTRSTSLGSGRKSSVRIGDAEHGVEEITAHRDVEGRQPPEDTDTAGQDADLFLRLSKGGRLLRIRRCRDRRRAMTPARCGVAASLRARSGEGASRRPPGRAARARPRAAGPPATAPGSSPPAAAGPSSAARRVPAVGSGRRAGPPRTKPTRPQRSRAP
jgi:regulator of nucleoside diphosphate kinase